MRFHRTCLIVPTCICAIASAGDLNPPAGPVAPTMLPLDKIETRQCINDLPGTPDAVHAITQPGVYFVGADIVAPPGMSAIVIDLPPGATEQVVIDLGGFTLRGNGGGTGSGIKLQSGPIFVLEPNVGRIAGFGSHGIEVDGAGSVSLDGATIDSCGGDGIHVVNSADVVISTFDISNCSGNGVTVIGADFMAINEKALPGRRHPKKDKKTNSRVTNVGGHGIHVSDCDDGNVEDFDIRLVGGDGVRVEHSVAGAQMRLGVANGGVEQAGGNGITVLGGQTIASAIIRRMHVRETIDALYAEDLESVFIEDWLDEDSDDDGIEIVTKLVSQPRNSITVISEATSLRAMARGIVVRKPAVGSGSSVGRLANCTVDGGGLTMTGIELEVSDAVLQNVQATGALGTGVSIGVSGALTVDGLTSANNGGGGVVVFGAGLATTDVTDLRAISNGHGGGGVSLDGALFEAVDTLTVRESTFSGNAGSGLRIADLNRDGMMDVIVCSANGSHGFASDAPSGVGSGRLVLVGGSFGSNSGDGIFLEATTGGQIADCTASNNSGFGIRLFGSGHIVQRNSLISNASGAMLVPVGNVVGPLVDELSIPGNSNPAANYVH